MKSLKDYKIEIPEWDAEMVGFSVQLSREEFELWKEQIERVNELLDKGWRWSIETSDCLKEGFFIPMEEDDSFEKLARDMTERLAKPSNERLDAEMFHEFGKRAKALLKESES